MPSFSWIAPSTQLLFVPVQTSWAFTTTFGQTVAFARHGRSSLKQRAPGIKTILGGANCDGVMGEALHRSFPWIDVVVRGEAEPVFGDLVDALLLRENAGAAPRLVSARGWRKTWIVPMTPPVAGKSRAR